jgi:hypothetical protein
MIFDFNKDGYDGVGNAGAYDRDQTLNVILDRRLTVTAGDSLTATIWGDDGFWAEELGNACHTPQVCRLVHLVTPGPGTVTVQLRPINRAYQLGFILFLWLSNYLFYAAEVPGSAGVVAVSADLPRGASYPVAVQIFGASRTDHQDFELTTQFVPR